MNRKELSEMILSTIKTNSNKKENLKNLNVCLDTLIKSIKSNNVSHKIHDRKTKEFFAFTELTSGFNDDLYSTIDAIIANDFYTAITHLDDLILRYYKYEDEVTPYEIYICSSIIQSMINSISLQLDRDAEMVSNINLTENKYQGHTQDPRPW